MTETSSRPAGLPARAAAAVRAVPRNTARAAARCWAALRSAARSTARLVTPRRLPVWWPLALCALLGLGAGAAFGLLRTPQYTATGYVAVVPDKERDPASALGFAQAYGRIATGTAVLRKAGEAADLPVRTLERGVRAVTSPDAPLVEVSGTDAEPRRAARMANAVATALTKLANDSAKSTSVKLTVFAEAPAPASPSSPAPVLTAAVGLCGGGLVGALLLLVRPRRRGRGADAAVPAPAVPDVKTTPVTASTPVRAAGRAADAMQADRRKRKKETVR